MRRTKIICTLGPATDDPDILRALIKGGMNAARFNFSHGTHEEQLERLNRFTGIRDELGAAVATVLDTKGPEIRVRSFAAPVDLVAGNEFVLTADDVVGDEHRVSVTYHDLPKELEPGQQILIDDGLIGLTVKEIRGADIVCTVVNGGHLSSNKSINIPGVHIHLPALTEQDIDDIRFGVENDFDFIAASFIRTAEDVKAIREVLHSFGGENIRIISKIENQEGVDNLDEIIAVSDGIMVARGDLGVEIPAARVPIIQKRMIRSGIAAGKLVITATQMLDSMIRNPRATRAEVSDVSNAVFDGTSCVMLSGETAAGKYPIEAFTSMDSIVREAEESVHYWKRFEKNHVRTQGLTAMDLGATAIMTTTNSGHTARMIARFRPACPIAALTMREKVRRQLSLSWGVVPYLTGEVTSTDRIFSLCTEVARKEGLVKSGDVVVITAGVPLGKSVETNLMKAEVIS